MPSTQKDRFSFEKRSESLTASALGAVRHFEAELMALLTVVDFGLMLHVAQRTVAVVRRPMRIRIELSGLFGNVVAVVATQAGLFVGVFVLHFRAVTGLAFDAARDMAVRAEVGGLYETGCARIQ